MEKLKFSGASDIGFQKDLNQRVNARFTELGIKKTGDWKIIQKAVIILIWWFLPVAIFYFLGFFGPERYLLATLAGLGMAGIGMCVMHDACHGVFSSTSWVNTLAEKSMYFLGGSIFNWKIQHNSIHHIETNVYEHDEDLGNGILFRFSKEQPWRWNHRFQAYYSVFLYSLMTILWITSKDWVQLNRYLRENTKLTKKEKRMKWVTLFVTKIFYYFFWLVLPIMIFGHFWEIISFFLTMHFVCGLTLTMVFQLAHVVPKAQTFMPEEVTENSWLVHQLKTSCNFATKNKFLGWYLGGLNFQKEHHLFFSTISHVHYKKIVSPIVRQFCKEKGIDYIEYSTFLNAFSAHFGFLKSLGMKYI